MAREYCGISFRRFVFWFVALIQLWSNEFAEGRISALRRTIKSGDGDIIDCIDIYKQPTFNDPLLKNHKIQLKQSSYLRELEATNSSIELFQSWHKDGECPLGTIPILRTTKFNSSFVSSNDDVPQEFAIASLPDAKYLAARGSLNVWNPSVADKEFSLSKMSVKSGNSTNAMQAGWMVKGGDNNPRFFIAWTRDGFKSTGCQNLDCPGFVQTNPKIALGAIIKPLSSYGGKQFEVILTIKKDENTGAWVLLFQGQVVGYWPKNLFTSLADKATTVSYGGEISNTKPKGKHTTTQMGSGHFAGESYGKAAYISHIEYIDRDRGIFTESRQLIAFVTRENCYNLNIDFSVNLGPTVFFGGPGYSADCQ